MEEELFISGYCKASDTARTVTLLMENGTLSEVDCRFGNCPYEPNCPIAEKIRHSLQA